MNCFIQLLRNQEGVGEKMNGTHGSYPAKIFQFLAACPCTRDLRLQRSTANRSEWSNSTQNHTLLQYGWLLASCWPVAILGT